jgi:hypothetical protein
MMISISATAASAILKARYFPVEGSDIEHGQGAIERNELPHHPLEPAVWLIRVPAQPDLSLWRKKLNAAVDPAHGCFDVELPSEEELRRVERGEITFQQ